MREIMVFSGNANIPLAEQIASHLQTPLGNAVVDTFSDGETLIEVLDNVRGGDIFIVQPTCAPTNENLMQLIIMADAIRRASATRITAVVPYFGYARQDRRVRSARVPITAKIVADMMESVGITRLITVDLHADQIQGFFYFPVDNVYATPIFLDHIQSLKLKDPLVVSPDVGGVVRARATAKLLNDAELAIIDKRRLGPNQAEAMHIIGDVTDRDCIIVDDILDTAGTLCTATKALKENGAATVRAFCTHPVLSGKAIENLNNSSIDQVIVADTIPLSLAAQQCNKIHQISLAPMLAETIHRVSEEDSVSSMFIG